MSKDKKPLRRSPEPRRRPPTSNYYRSGAASNPSSDSPFKKKAKKSSGVSRFLARFVDIIFVMALLIGLGYSLTVSSNSKIIVNDSFYHSLDNYRDSTKHYLTAIKDSNKISFDENGISNGLMLDYPEIDNVTVELPVFSQQPVIRITVAAPSFILSSGGQRYVIDANGKAIGLISNFRKTSSLPVLTDQSNYPVKVGKAVLSSSDIAFIESVISESDKAGVKIDSLMLPNTPAELDLKPAGKSFLVMFYLPGDSAVQIGQFLAAMHQFESGEQPTQYIDVRVAGKIFYK